MEINEVALIVPPPLEMQCPHREEDQYWAKTSAQFVKLELGSHVAAEGR